MYDLFNGDADGICALHQLRLQKPAESVLVTGLKRDISLCSKISPEKGDVVTAMDIALEANAGQVDRFLRSGVRVVYFDHHACSRIPRRPLFEGHLDFSKHTCTSLIVNRFLNDRFFAWGAIGAFGDGMNDAAAELCRRHGLSEERTSLLQELGRLMNYNGFGESVDDLHYSPENLYGLIRSYEDPFEFIECESVLAHLRQAYQEDLARARTAASHHETTSSKVITLEDHAWSRRICRIYADEMMQAYPKKTITVLVRKLDGAYSECVRSHGGARFSAAWLRRKFEQMCR
ncbi:MAG: hypothetical protein A3C47_04585 [Omnitrophica bacterium RIFCSPHIGHO2_02_FULL_51_18]|nr:MAG: hypothetical protein A3C47_04585 [Omnitrophica bacterium RIFCSPHIGHO2_02_FULL_51_18]